MSRSNEEECEAIRDEMAKRISNRLKNKDIQWAFSITLPDSVRPDGVITYQAEGKGSEYQTRDRHLPTRETP